MKALKNLFYWVVLPGIFAGSVALNDHQLALAGSVLLWAVALIVGPMALLALFAMVSIKPGDPKWASNKESVLKLKPGFLKRSISWLALFVTVVLCAYTGFVVTAVFYLIGALWCKLAFAIIINHYETAVEQK